MSKARVVAELWRFLLQEKKYWVLPIAIVFIMLGLLIAFAQTSPVAPFIYSLF